MKLSNVRVEKHVIWPPFWKYYPPTWGIENSLSFSVSLAVFPVDLEVTTRLLGY